MVRINLLPAEIIERRKYERYYPVILLVGAVVLVLLLVAAGALSVFSNQRNTQLQQSREQIAALKQKAEELKIFEEQQQALEARQQVANVALAARVEMGKLMEEVSLVLPDALWVDAMTLHQDEGLTVHGYTPDSARGAQDSSYKSIAAALVRINSLEDIEDVWLNQAASTIYTDFQGGAEGEAKTIEFEIGGRIIRDAGVTVEGDDVPAAPPAEND